MVERSIEPWIRHSVLRCGNAPVVVQVSLCCQSEWVNVVQSALSGQNTCKSAIKLQSIYHILYMSNLVSVICLRDYRNLI